MDEERTLPTLDELIAREPSKYLTTQEKDELVETGEPFLIVSAEVTTGAFGERWELDLLLSDGSSKSLTLPAREVRTKMMEGIALLCQQKGPQGPLALASVPTKWPNPYYFFIRPVQEETTDATA